VAYPAERQYAANKFYLVDEPSGHACKFRCVYCERDIEDEATARCVAADTVRKTFAPAATSLVQAPAEKLKHTIIYATEAEALAAGFAPREGGKKVRAS